MYYFFAGQNICRITAVLQKQVMLKRVSLKPTSGSCSRAYCMDLKPFSSYTVWTHTLTTWTAANWTEKDSGSSKFYNCPRRIAWTYYNNDMLYIELQKCMWTLHLRQFICTHTFCRPNFNGRYSTTKKAKIISPTPLAKNTHYIVCNQFGWNFNTSDMFSVIIAP